MRPAWYVLVIFYESYLLGLIPIPPLFKRLEKVGITVFFLV